MVCPARAGRSWRSSIRRCRPGSKRSAPARPANPACSIYSARALLRVSAKVDKSRRDDSLQLMLESAAALEPATGDTANIASQPQALEPPPQMDLEGQVDAILADSGGGAMIAPTDDAPHPADSMG